MRRGAAVILQALVLLVGLGALAFLLIEPHFEGRNVDATPFEVYFKDPFLAYVYLGSIPFFVALRQAFKALGYAGRGQASSPVTAEALRTAKLCSLAFLAFIAGGEVIILLTPSDDRAGGIVIGLLAGLVATAMAAAAAKFERLVRNAAG